MRRFFYLFIFIFFIITSPLSIAGECEYGSLRAWVKTLDENGNWNEWENSTVYKTLKVHEPFKIKAKITTKKEISWLYLWLEEIGSSKIYEIVKGESDIGIYGKIISVNNVPEGWSKIYEWIARPTGNWTNGIAPLNIKAQFSTMEDDKFIEFTVIVAYIELEKWKYDKGGEYDKGGGSIPGFLSILIIISLLLNAGFICKSKKRI